MHVWQLDIVVQKLWLGQGDNCKIPSISLDKKYNTFLCVYGTEISQWTVDLKIQVIKVFSEHLSKTVDGWSWNCHMGNSVGFNLGLSIAFYQYWWPYILSERLPLLFFLILLSIDLLIGQYPINTYGIRRMVWCWGKNSKFLLYFH